MKLKSKMFCYERPSLTYNSQLQTKNVQSIIEGSKVVTKALFKIAKRYLQKTCRQVSPNVYKLKYLFSNCKKNSISSQNFLFFINWHQVNYFGSAARHSCSTFVLNTFKNDRWPTGAVITVGWSDNISVKFPLTTGRFLVQFRSEVIIIFTISFVKFVLDLLKI